MTQAKLLKSNEFTDFFVKVRASYSYPALFHCKNKKLLIKHIRNTNDNL